MSRQFKILSLVLCMALLLTGCGLRTVDELYCLPDRSDTDKDVQKVIDKEMQGLSYCPPLGENRQVTQKVDLDGDGVEEFLVFAKDSSDKPLKILIFCQLASGYVLMDTIEGYGFAFDFVSYAQIDGEPGLEIIVGRQVSNQIMRSVSVYRFSSGFSRHLLTTGYTRSMICDLDANGVSELLLLKASETEDGKATVSLYQQLDEQLQHMQTMELSVAIEKVRRSTVGILYSGRPALFVSGVNQEDKLQTDIFTLTDGVLSYISAADAVAPLDSQYIYPEDIDGDGRLELPALVPVSSHPGSEQSHFYVRWYCMDADGQDYDKLYTYMDYNAGWYLKLKKDLLDRLSVVKDTEASTLYLWDEGHKSARKLLTIYTLTDSDREQVAEQKGYTILHKADAVIYAAVLEPAAAGCGITSASLAVDFCLMRTELDADEK